jgi:protein TonB
LGVICAHLTLLWWTQVNQQTSPPQVLPILFQLSPQIPPAVQPVVPPAPTAKSSPKKQAPRHSEQTQPQATVTTTTPATINPVSAQIAQAATVKVGELPPAGVTSGSGNVPKTDSAPTSPPLATKPDAVQLPSSSAQYLNNPQPAYPLVSKRLGEQGTAVIHVLISKDGSALQGDVFQSSGFERLDQVALRTVLTWRYVPGRLNGQAQDMWFYVPINFKLN